MQKDIIIKGARQHNLKGVNVSIPRHKFVVITGLSGSGKSSLAFDTLYAEGQRRYVESLSSYARQFLDQMQKPDVEHIEGLSPAIAIEQRLAGSNPRSTVATTTEIYDYLRLLYAHAGRPHCPKCGKTVSGQSAEAICTKLQLYPEGMKMMILAPYISGKKGEHKEVIQQIFQDGFVRVRIDGAIFAEGDALPKIAKTKSHTIEAVVDRLVAGESDSTRLTDSVELALKFGGGNITLLTETQNEWEEEKISEHLACSDCDISFGELAPRNFSFNSPYGACKKCHGLGSQLVFEEDLLIQDRSLSIKKGAIPDWRRGPRRLIIYYNHLIKCLAVHLDCPDMIKTPFQDLSKKTQKIILYGTGDEIVSFDFRMRGKMRKSEKPWEGIIPNLERRYVETESDSVRDRLRKKMHPVQCTACNGSRLNPVSLAVKVGKLGIDEFNALNIDEADDFMQKLPDLFNEEENQIGGEIICEIRSRLRFLKDVGLSYLTLDRESGTLSGGEAQRIRLATQIGSGLTGVLYILDEPSIGLHQRDNEKLLNTLEKLRDTGNTVIVVEHDLETIKRADYIIDLGPKAGKHGGEIVAEGTYKDLEKAPKSFTGKYLSGEMSIAMPEKRCKGSGKFITIKGARQNNLKNINVKIPLGTFCCITGVSGSGKSSLIDDTLRIALNRHFDIGTEAPGKHDSIEGLCEIGKAIVIDQSPIGRTPRSNPATYTDAFTIIRDIYAKLPESKVRGYKPGRFSFNVKGGRCEACKGDGVKKIEMQFLPNVYVTCSVCGGKRFNQETLGITFKGRNIADVLDMTVNEACNFFSAIPRLHRKLITLSDVGLGYIHLGQQATTLSGGEAQRVKLASELAKIPRGHTIYILDEPTTGLHIHDVNKLMDVLFMLRDKGNTVVVIEHNLDLIKAADHIIDLGPEGGDLGGKIVAQGTPEKVAKSAKSYTGQYLKKMLSLSIFLFSALFLNAEDENVVYSNTFDSEPGKEWSSNSTQETPKDKRKFLGNFGQEAVTLTLKNLKKHSMLKVSFDLYLIRTWDGSSENWGPDIWSLTTKDGRKLIYSTFTNCGFFSDNNKQTFPDFHPSSIIHPGCTGASEKKSLGYIMEWGGGEGRRHSTDSVYHFDLVFPHSSEDLTLNFASLCKDNIKDQSWGVDNIKVELIDKAIPLKNSSSDNLWDALSAPDALNAYKAIWQLIAAADEGVEYIKNRNLINKPPVKPDLQKLIIQLNDEQYSVREGATAQLIKVGVHQKEILQRALKTTQSPEVSYRLKLILKKIAPVKLVKNPKFILFERVSHILEIIGTEKAKSLKGKL